MPTVYYVIYVFLLAPMYVQCDHIIMFMVWVIVENTTYSSIAKLRNAEVSASIELYYMSSLISARKWCNIGLLA